MTFQVDSFVSVWEKKTKSPMITVKKVIYSITLVGAWFFFATLFYKTICVVLLFLVWRKVLAEKVPKRYRNLSIRAVWLCLGFTLWIAMPRYRINSGDRVRLLYVDKEGNTQRPPISHWLLSMLLPEEEIVNVGVKCIEYNAPLIRMAGLGNTLIEQAQNDINSGKIGNFFKPYKRLGLNNPISGVYSQVFNEKLGTNYNAFYLCEPKYYDRNKAYPLIVFCHGYLGNWQMYQGLWKDLDGAIVASIGTRDLSGIFGQQDINSIFNFYIPMLERMGYLVDHQQIHLMGLSNGVSSINAAMHSRHVMDFKSITSISCNLDGLRRMPCQVNLIGGGKDNSAGRMPAQYRELRKMRVDADIFFDTDENHYIMVNKREEILSFIKERLAI